MPPGALQRARDYPPLRFRIALHPGIAPRAPVQQPGHPEAGLRVENRNPARHRSSLQQLRAQGAGLLAPYRGEQCATWARLTVRADNAAVLIPDDGPLRAQQPCMPKAMLLCRVGTEAGDQHPQIRIQGARDLDGIPRVVDFHRINGRRELSIVIAAPARHLRPLEGGKRLRVAAVDGLRTGAHGPGKCDIHPCLELHPGRHGCIASERVTGQGRRDGLPRRELGSPGTVKGGEASVALLQPGPHGFQRGRREIEVPSCCEIGDTALVSQIVKERTIEGLRACDLRQSGLDGREPGGIGETGLTMENGRVIGIAPVPGFGLVEQPGHRAPRRPAVIGA